MPGDVIWCEKSDGTCGHIIIYIGDYGGEYGVYAHASRSSRVGTIGPAYGFNDGRTVYRYVGDKLNN